MALRRYCEQSPKSVAEEILVDVLRRGESYGWAGELDELATIKRILRPFNVAYVDDMGGGWALSPERCAE